MTTIALPRSSHPQLGTAGPSVALSLVLRRQRTRRILPWFPATTWMMISQFAGPQQMRTLCRRCRLSLGWATLCQRRRMTMAMRKRRLPLMQKMRVAWEVVRKGLLCQGFDYFEGLSKFDQSLNATLGRNLTQAKIEHFFHPTTM
jgi:hypothetical protein